MRSIIDSNITLMLLYRLLPEDHKDEICAKMYRMAVTRVTRKVRPEELNIAQMLQEGLNQGLDQEPSNGRKVASA